MEVAYFTLSDKQLYANLDKLLEGPKAILPPPPATKLLGGGLAPAAPPPVSTPMQPATCGLSRISYAYLTWVAMWDRFFRQRAYIGITRSRMPWYVRKKNPSLGITVWHHSAIPRDGIFYPTLTRIMDSFSCSPLFSSRSP